MYWLDFQRTAYLVLAVHTRAQYNMGLQLLLSFRTNTNDLDWLLLLLIDVISRRTRIERGASTRMGWHKWPLWATSTRYVPTLSARTKTRLLNLEIGLTWKRAVGASGHFTVTRIVRRCTGRLAGVRPGLQNKLSRIERIAKLIGYKYVAPLLENYWTILSVMSSWLIELKSDDNNSNTDRHDDHCEHIPRILNHISLYCCGIHIRLRLIILPSGATSRTILLCDYCTLHGWY